MLVLPCPLLDPMTWRANSVSAALTPPSEVLRAEGVPDEEGEEAVDRRPETREQLRPSF